MFEYGMGAQVRTNKKKALQHFTVALLGVQALIVAKTDDVIGSIVSIALAIKDEDVINVFLPQVGDIGIFVSAAELWQQPSGLCVPACPLHPRCGHRCSMAPASCAALRAHVDRAHLLAAVHWATHLSLHGRSRRTTTPSNKFLLQFTTWQRHISAPH